MARKGGKKRNVRPRNSQKMQGVPLSLNAPGNTRVFRCTRQRELGIIPPTNDSGGAYEFMLSDVGGYTELTVLFDQYRIEGVEVIFTASQSNSSSYVWPRVYCAFDPDDNDTPPNLLSLRERGNTKIYAFSPNKREYRVNLRPKGRIMAYTETGSKASIQTRTGEWYDCNQAAVPLYGLKYWLEDFTIGIGSPPMRVIMRYFLAFRGVR